MSAGPRPYVVRTLPNSAVDPPGPPPQGNAATAPSRSLPPTGAARLSGGGRHYQVRVVQQRDVAQPAPGRAHLRPLQPSQLLGDRRRGHLQRPHRGQHAEPTGIEVHCVLVVSKAEPLLQDLAIPLHGQLAQTGPVTTQTSADVRACFHAEVAFLNGGSLTVRDFRLDVEHAGLSAAEVGQLLVDHLGLLMVASIQVSNLRFVQEAHKGSCGASSGPASGSSPGVRLVDLTHPIEADMITYPGLRGPRLGVHLSRPDSAAHYAPGTEFEIGTIDMIGNTGTYLDAPWHRYADGTDLAGLPLARTAALDAVVVDVTGLAERGVDVLALTAVPVTGRAVLLRTGWDRHWRTDAYGVDAPFLTRAGAQLLADRGAALVGIDAVNIDDVGDPQRPAHTVLLGAGVPVLEHLTGLSALPAEGFRLHAAPVPVRRFGTMPVRAYAVLET